MSLMDRHSPAASKQRCWCFFTERADRSASYNKKERCCCYFSASGCHYFALGLGASVTWIYFIGMIVFAVHYHLFHNKRDISYFEIMFPTVRFCFGFSNYIYI